MINIRANQSPVSALLLRAGDNISDYSGFDIRLAGVPDWVSTDIHSCRMSASTCSNRVLASHES